MANQKTGSATEKEGSSWWKDILGIVTTPIRFFTLVALIIDGALGGVALKTSGTAQLLTLCFAFLILVGLIIIVAFKKNLNDGNKVLQDFCDKVIGYWWEKIEPPTTSAISFVQIYYDKIKNTVNMEASAYDKDGKFLGNWKSFMSCIQPNERKIFYYWEGINVPTAVQQYVGFGWIFLTNFNDNKKRFESGNGYYSDITSPISSPNNPTTTKLVNYKLCDSEQERETMINGTGLKKSKLVLEKLH